MSTSHRRDFLRAAGAAAIATAAHPILGANDRIRVGIIGLGGRGNNHMTSYAAIQTCEVAGLCDVNQAARERGVALIQKLRGNRPKEYQDMRQMFEDKDIDAVSMATPNHWHSLGTIWAVQAGKDVYCEKPASHNIYEGRKMTEAARKYKRMVQIGSQSRSKPHMIKAVQLLREGVIGKVYMAKGLCYKRRKSIGVTPAEPVPAGVNWDMFLGPAPMRPFTQNRFKYNWHWFWDTGNGDIGNQGIHEMDIARWGLGVDLPTNAVSTGGKYVYVDDQETPNTQLATFDYGDKQIVFEVRGIITGGESSFQPRGNATVGVVFYGGDGYMVLSGGGFSVYKGEDRQLTMEEKPAPGDTKEHIENFLAAVRSRKHTDLSADVEIGAKSMELVHLANISYRVKRAIQYDYASMTIKNDPEAAKLLTREYRAPYLITDRV
ncbi:MAG: Gfo/Idh/MocA family oxidoreductase [Bryobacteraceae bacterium]|nr:Gfo/Idh/MocA family oxidoreductase [Bryobacteraceae bacterium]MCO5353572.1 Gfo/Idh/MocA family oxidoreductase [Bryobacteraceae bacterium]